MFQLRDIHKSMKKKIKMKKDIHTWNKYISGKLCCSTCDISYNQYLQESDE